MASLPADPFKFAQDLLGALGGLISVQVPDEAPETVNITVDTPSEDDRIRERALELALRHGGVTPDSIVDTAAKFEKFLRGQQSS